AVGLGAVF
nr:Chain G, HIV fusion peptide 512-519 V2 [Human immunodeficiency virus 1]6X78_I Chain I, HIV fusion peptide 512-519 V2 [Human immunodeficiency virus 1]